MKPSKTKARQPNRATQGDKPVNPSPIKGITHSEITAWVGKLTLQNLDSVGRQLVRVYDAAGAKDIDTLKEIRRSSRGMVGRLAGSAIAAPPDNTYVATESIRHALERLFFFSCEYNFGWQAYLQKLRKENESKGGSQ